MIKITMVSVSFYVDHIHEYYICKISNHLCDIITYLYDVTARRRLKTWYTLCRNLYYKYPINYYCIM